MIGFFVFAWSLVDSSLGSCLGQHQKRHRVKTGGVASVDGDFSYALFIVIGISFFIPFVRLSS